MFYKIVFIFLIYFSQTIYSFAECSEAFERRRILDENGQPKAKYIGPAGYARYATDYHSGNMHKAFVNVSAILGGAKVMKSLGLGWRTGWPAHQTEDAWQSVTIRLEGEFRLSVHTSGMRWVEIKD